MLVSCAKGKIRDRITKRCRNTKSSHKKSSPTLRNKKSLRKKTSYAWERAIRSNERYYEDRQAGKITNPVRAYIKRANQSYALTVDLLDVASGISWNRGSKNVSMSDIRQAKTVDSMLQTNFP